MTPISRPVEEQQIACEICMKEVPVSEAHSAEASEYVIHFCGLDCYAVWRAQQKQDTATEKAIAPSPG